MRYRIKDIEIRSENAAKPATDASACLVEWLRDREYTQSALDFGCGKLRYTPHLAKKSKRLGIVDSEVQITRNQIIDGGYTSVHEYVRRKWPQCRIHVLEEFCKNPSHRYHFILCANVLSAIPCPKARAMSLRAIYNALLSNGQVLFVNQHSNSYFKEAPKKPNTRLHLDGWIVQSRGGASYYGILNKDSVIRLVVRYGFSIDKAWVEGQSNYVIASREKI
jgi:hypothetical protein